MAEGPRRLFFALWPDEPTRAQLQAVASSCLTGWHGRALEVCDLHVTLCFLGAAAQASVQPLCERTASLAAPPIQLEFDRLQYWDASRTLVLSAGEPPPAAQSLATALAQIARSTGLTPAAHALRPHVTLMRSVKAPTQHVATPDNSRLAPVILRATRFYLAQSHELGAATLAVAELPRYRLIADWPLRG